MGESSEDRVLLMALSSLEAGAQTGLHSEKAKSQSSPGAESLQRWCSGELVGHQALSSED